MSDAIEVKGRRKRVAAKKSIVDEPSDHSDVDARKKVKVAKAAQKKGRGPVKKTVVEEAEPEEQDQPTEDTETLKSAAQPKKKKKTVAISSRDQFRSPDKDSEDEVVSPFANVATKNRRATMFVPSSGLLSDEEESTGDEQMGTSSTPVNKKSKKKSSKTVPKETEKEKKEEPKDENPNGTFVVQNSLAPDQPKPTIVNQPRRGGRARAQKTYQEDSADDMVPAKKVGRKAAKKVTVAEEPTMATSPAKKDEELREGSADEMVPAKKVGRKAAKKVTVAEEPTMATSPAKKDEELREDSADDMVPAKKVGRKAAKKVTVAEEPTMATSPAKKDEELREDSADDMAPVPRQKKWVKIRRVDLKVVQPAGQPPLSRKKKEQSGASEATAPVIVKKAGKKKASEVERDVEEGKIEKDEPAVQEKPDKKKGKAATKDVEEESEKKDEEDEGKSSVAPVVSSDKPVKKTKKGKAAKNSVADEKGEVHKEEEPEKEDRGEEKSVPVDVAKPKGRGRAASKQKVTGEPADTENDSAEKEPKRSARGRTQSAVSTKTSAANGKKRGKPETVAEEDEGEDDVFEEQGTQGQDATTVAKTEPAKKRGRVASAKAAEKADEPELSPDKTEKKGRSRKASKKH